MLLWFLLATVSLLFVAVDIRTTPESPVLKWGFVLLTAYTGVVGAFLYVLGCGEPLPGLHERTSLRAGGRRWDRRCTASPATGLALLPAPRSRACLGSPAWPRSSSNTFSASPSAGRFSRRCSCATGGGLISACAEQHLHLRTTLHEPV